MHYFHQTLGDMARPKQILLKLILERMNCLASKKSNPDYFRKMTKTSVQKKVYLG